MHHKKIINQNLEPREASRLLIMVHGRGGTAADILSLAAYLDVKEYALLAPEATGNSWYPQSFLAPPKANEPWLSSALALLASTVEEGLNAGIPKEKIFFLGFSQGACLCLEFIARNAGRWGGVVAFTGGLIGDRIYPENYQGDFGHTPIFVGSSNPDPHVPVERVYATVNILRQMNADVTEKIYTNMGHTVSQDEINLANSLVFNSGGVPDDKKI
jgi:phospholipase/carboxylesterase